MKSCPPQFFFFEIFGVFPTPILFNILYGINFDNQFPTQVGQTVCSKDSGVTLELGGIQQLRRQIFGYF